MRPDKGVFKRKGSDVWQHRLYVPSHLRHHFAGKCELPARSLGTKDLAEANRRARLRAAEHERMLAALKANSNASGIGFANDQALAPMLTAPLIERLATQHRADVIDQDFAARAVVYARAKADPQAFWRGEVIALPEDWQVPHHGLSYWDFLCSDEETTLEKGVAFLLTAERKSRLDALKEALRIGSTDLVAPMVDAILAKFSCEEVQRLRLAKRLLEAEVSALTTIVSGEAAHFPGVFDNGAEAQPPVAKDAENPLLSHAVTSWLDEKAALADQRRIEDCKAAVALFTEVAGDKPVASYSKGDVRRFKEVLRKLPANRNKRPETRGLSIAQAIRKAERLGLEPMAPKTANNKYIGALYNFFEYAIGNYDSVDRNPFQNATLPTTTTPREEWDPFSLEALRIFFNAPLYRGCKSVREWMEPGSEVPRDSARFWVPLLLLYTGARVNEVCKLRTADVSEEGGIAFISIVWEEDDEASGIAGRVKNFASARQVPLHDDLARFGFLEFVARMRGAGHERLFAELKPNRYGKLYDGISKRFSDTFLPRLGIKTDKTSLKSFRHNFVDAALNSRIPEEIVQALKGDTRPGTLGRYGKGKTDLEILADEMKKLLFKGLDLGHLRVQ